MSLIFLVISGKFHKFPSVEFPENSQPYWPLLTRPTEISEAQPWLGDWKGICPLKKLAAANPK